MTTTNAFSDFKAIDSRKEYERCKLTPQQESAWEMTRAALLWNFPAFTHILCSMMNPSGGQEIALFTKDEHMPTMATDGVNLIINPDFFFAKPLNQRIFGVAHEIMHNVFDHCGMGYHHRKLGKVVTSAGKSLPYDHKMMNVAQDLVINDVLVQSKVGEMIPGGCHDTKVAVAGDSVVDVYKKLYDEQQKGGGKSPDNSPNGSRNGQQVFDQHLDPGSGQGQDPAQAQADRSKAEWDTAVAAAIASAKAQGKLPAALERLFQDVLEPKVTWTEYVRGFFARKTGGGAYDWRKADRRMLVRDIITPARSGHGAGLVIVPIDTSGSIGQETLDMFLAELNGVLQDVKPARTLVMWIDAKVHRVDEVDELTELKGLKPVGGGGTDFIPAFDWIDKEGLTPDAVIYLTDMYGRFPQQEPNYPVLWASISPGVGAPFGEVVEIPHD